MPLATLSAVKQCAQATWLLDKTTLAVLASLARFTNDSLAHAHHWDGSFTKGGVKQLEQNCRVTILAVARTIALTREVAGIAVSCLVLPCLALPCLALLGLAVPCRAVL